jgi:hypothetical protein
VANLNHLIPQGSGLHIAYAHAVNNAGQIAATAFDAQGHYHAVLLTPGTIPAPQPGSRSSTSRSPKARAARKPRPSP